MPEIKRGAHVDRIEIKLWQRAMHEPKPLDPRRHAEGADRLVDDDAQVVLLPLHVVYRLFLGYWSSVPFSRAGVTSPSNAHAPGDFLSALPSAHDALRRGGVGAGWTTRDSKRVRRWCDHVAFHFNSDTHGLAAARPD
jgi:hypothetical protein